MDPEDAHPLSHSHIRSLLSPSGISFSERNWRLKFLWDQESLELLDLLVLTPENIWPNHVRYIGS